MTLQAARIEFTKCLGRLLAFGEANGFALMIDETKRAQAAADWNANHCRIFVQGKRCERPMAIHGALDHAFKPIGSAKSVHLNGLAADIYIIEDGRISNDKGKYAILAGHWKALHGLARWGGDFEGFPDLGHFSFTWEGRS